MGKREDSPVSNPNVLVEEPIVIRGVTWRDGIGVRGARDLSVAAFARHGHADLARICVGPTQATWRGGDGGGPVLTIEQARAFAAALTEACDRAERELGRGGL
jgi:hypothetical protein